jgi:ubiquinone/menaquinone biosynthesis C-methylase UbiE
MLILESTALVLNLGSGGNDQGIISKRTIHVDVAIRRIMGVKDSILGDINYLPIAGGIADLVVCVGGVINYAGPHTAIKEICRATKVGGYILLEFESSKSLEFDISTVFGRDIVSVNTFFNNRSEKIQVYSENFISRLLMQSGARIEVVESFHILSSLALRFCRSEETAQRWARFDHLARLIPGLRRCGSNIILLAKKVDRSKD